jgi:hypothetical protein
MKQRPSLDLDSKNIFHTIFLKCLRQMQLQA